ncbi:endonuclease/exonuclease/phosphatase family protein [Nocardioides sp. SYSU DS0651]|uniref:endonuclease/exonuclease/phosphatase family protein n=1 Tax=Nocardioides sp. SYSU DS0651 TaxID=3415955 RepID=UPI003F4B3D0A
MNQPAERIPRGVRRTRRLRATVAAAVAAGVGLVVAPVPSPATSAPAPSAVAARSECPAQRTMRMTEANIKSGMSAAKTRRDIAKVYAVKPDFVAFNEVPYRSDDELTPDAYDIWRSPGRYIGANAVAWHADRWTPIARGTIYVSNVPGKVAGQTSEWGIRYANWATLRSTDGCQVVSVVSYHVAPRNEITKNLLLPSVRRLGALTKYLATSGPVILAGDMNVHYNGARYPRAELTAGGMTPTFDITGKKMPTHDGGGIIDYIFVNRGEQFAVTKQVTHELYSDHDLLIADLVLDRTVDVPAVSPSVMRGHVLNVPESPIRRARIEVVRQYMLAIRNTPPGEKVRFATDALNDSRIRNELAAAYRRGAHVNFVTTNPRPTRYEQSLIDLLGSSKSRDSWAVVRPQAKSDELRLPPAFFLATVSAGKRYVRIDADEPARPARMGLRTTRAQMYTQLKEYDAMRLKFQRLAR